MGVPADVTVECTAIPAAATVTASDNCDATLTVNYQETSNSVTEGCGTIVRTWTVTDNCGNSTTATQTITVQDTQPPTLVGVPADVTVECTAIPAAATVTASDNCDATLTVNYQETSNSVTEGCGTIVRTWTVTDNCGNSTTATQTITVQDTQPPTLVGVPADVTVECTAIPAAATVTASDNCDATLTVNYQETSNSVTEGCGTIVRTWTVTDNCGNSTTATQTITVQDTQPPTLVGVPADVTVECTAIPAAATVTASDNCDATLTVNYQETSNSVTEGCGTIVSTWTVTDNCGNTTTATQTITVQDTQPPTLVGVPADVTVECTAIPAAATVTASDLCDPTLTVNYTETSNTVTEGCGTIVSTWTVTDNCGNTATATQTITVQDTQAPTLVGVPADVTVECTAIPAPLPLRLLTSATLL